MSGIALERSHVTGHRLLPDTMFINTSRIEHIEVKEETGEVIIQTENTECHCRLSDCDFSRPDIYELISGMDKYAEIFGKELSAGEQYDPSGAVRSRKLLL